MSSWRPFCHAVHLTALGLWAGAIITSAATAAVAFPTMKSMGVQVPNLAPGFEPDHFRFAAGAVAQQVFTISDIIAFACAMTSATTLLVMVGVFKISPRRPTTILRSMALAVALACLASMLLIVTPQINTASQLHYNAAKTGDVAAAKLHKQAVDDLHPIASDLLAGEIVCVLIALFAGAWSLASTAPEPKKIADDVYPEPDLLRAKKF